MNTLNALLTREAREQMNLVIVAFLAVPVLVIGLQLEFLVDSPYSHEWVSLWIIPGVVLTMLLALTMDSTTRESGSDMGESLSRLPVSRRSLLAAKFIWLAAVAVVLLAWAYLAEALCAFGRGGMPATVDLHLAKAEHLPAYLCMGFSLLLMASLGLWIGRTFVTGTVFLAIVLGTVALIRANERLVRALPEVLPREFVFTALPLCLLLAGALTYRLGYALPRENLRRAALFLGVFGCASGGVVLGHWEGHAAAMVPGSGEGRPSFSELSPDGDKLFLWCNGTYETLLGGHGYAAEVLVFDTGSWERGCLGREDIEARVRAFDLEMLGRRGNPYLYEASENGVITRRLAGGARAEFCRLPALDGATYASVGGDSPGDYLYVHIRHDDHTTSGVYLDESTGDVLQFLPRGWGHSRWGNRPDWIATARHRSLRPTQKEPNSLSLVGREGIREIPVSGWGLVMPLLDGNLVYVVDGQALLLDPDGKQLRVIYEPRDPTL